MQTVEHQPTDESGSDSDEGESTSSSYSSLSDFVSEMVSSDLSPGYNSLHEQRKANAQHMSFSSSVDVETVYNPPSELRYPDGNTPIVRSDSPQSTSSSESDLSSPDFNRDSELEFGNKTKSEQAVFKTDRDETGSYENESDSNSTTTPKTVVSTNNVKPGSPTSETDKSSNSRKGRRSITPVSIVKLYFINTLYSRYDIRRSSPSSSRPFPRAYVLFPLRCFVLRYIPFTP